MSFDNSKKEGSHVFESLSQDYFSSGTLVQKIKTLCIEVSFVQKTTQQSNSICNATSGGHFLPKFLGKQSLFSAFTYEKYIVYKDYENAHHYDKLCLLPNCSFHNILEADIDELLQKLDAFGFKYDHMDCLYKLFEDQLNQKNGCQKQPIVLKYAKSELFQPNKQRSGQNTRHFQKKIFEEKVQKALIELFLNNKFNVNILISIGGET